MLLWPFLVANLLACSVWPSLPSYCIFDLLVSFLVGKICFYLWLRQRLGARSPSGKMSTASTNHLGVVLRWWSPHFPLLSCVYMPIFGFHVHAHLFEGNNFLAAGVRYNFGRCWPRPSGTCGSLIGWLVWHMSPHTRCLMKLNERRKSNDDFWVLKAKKSRNHPIYCVLYVLFCGTEIYMTCWSQF